MATWVTQMVDDTDLTFASISTYVWGMRTWHVLQHQADPAMGVMHWKEFMSGVAVMTARMVLTPDKRREGDHPFGSEWAGHVARGILESIYYFG